MHTSSVKPGAMMVKRAAGSAVDSLIGSHLKNSARYDTAFSVTQTTAALDNF